jgi:hypothetical protein
MKTVLDIVDIVWQHINNSSLKTAINGVVCKRRPVNSKLEDVVINGLAVSNLQLQSSVVNVNIYVPNKAQKIGGEQDLTQPDFARLQQLASIACTILTDIWAGDYNFDVQQTVGPFETEDNQHYINIRVDFNSINILN